MKEEEEEGGEEMRGKGPRCSLFLFPFLSFLSSFFLSFFLSSSSPSPTMAGIPDIGDAGYVAAVIAQYPNLADHEDLVTSARDVHLSLRAIALEDVPSQKVESLADQPTPHNFFWPTCVGERQSGFFGPDPTHFTYMGRPVPPL